MDDHAGNDQFPAPHDLEVAEREALGRIVHALREYRVDAEWEIARWEYNYNRLSDAHKSLVPNFPVKIAAARQCTYQNHLFLKSLLASFSDPASAPPALAHANIAAEEWALKVQNRVNPADAEKVRYVFKNLMRDWSGEGAAEREQSYGKILIELTRLFPSVVAYNRNSKFRHIAVMQQQELQQIYQQQQQQKEGGGIQGDAEGHQPSSSSHHNHTSTTATATTNNNNTQQQQAHATPAVLVPGTGLGRLCAEIAGLGFESIGNEFSYYMLLASTFILNHTERAEQWTIHPWLYSSCNQLNDADQLRPVAVPDVEPIELVAGSGHMGMCAGDFVEVFKHSDYKQYFEAVVTCFFLDTAHNVIEYLETIWHALKPGGYWINFGPLLWHWADSHTFLPQAELSIELSLRDIERIAIQMGFKMQRSEIVKAAYMSNCRSLLKQEYDCVFWTMQKPPFDD